jgi:uncharacterized damage-inducible protein DinB
MVSEALEVWDEEDVSRTRGETSANADDEEDQHYMEELYTSLELLQARVLEALGEIPDERLHWKPTAASTSPAEIVWHMANTERRLAALARDVDPKSLDAEAGTIAWIDRAGRGEADTRDVPRDRAGLEAALASARQETLAVLGELSLSELEEMAIEFNGRRQTRGFWLRLIVTHHSYHAGQLFMLGALIRGGL